MNCLPGDIVIVKGIIFENGKEDHSKNGRPCVVLFSKMNGGKESLRLLPLTSQIEKINFYNCTDKYALIDTQAALGLANLSYVYVVDFANVINIVNNMGRDYFRLAKCFEKYHKNVNSVTLFESLEKIKFYKSHSDLVGNILDQRQKMFRIKHREMRKARKGHYVEEDVIEKKLVKKKKMQHKRRKEALELKEMNY